jgi:hypothetical protein
MGLKSSPIFTKQLGLRAPLLLRLFGRPNLGAVVELSDWQLALNSDPLKETQQKL